MLTIVFIKSIVLSFLWERRIYDFCRTGPDGEDAAALRAKSRRTIWAYYNPLLMDQTVMQRERFQPNGVR